MNPADPRFLLDRHGARVLSHWRERLRALPPSSALAHPDMLMPMMAPALARVRQEASHAAHAAGGVVEEGAEAAVCRCGLNPLVAFYLTGECATLDVLWGQTDVSRQIGPAERESLCATLSAAWRRVAAEEIALFCSLCQRGAERAKDDAMQASRGHGHTHAHGHRHERVLERAGAGELVSASGRGACSGSRGKS